jgi:low temperature requirement protein LtrA
LISQDEGDESNDEHRAATPLELFYDLVSVIAIAAAARLLHHSLSEGHIVNGITLYFMTFWTIWWAWMNFTWHASSSDTGDAPYRVAVFVQITGALVMAVGIDQMFEELDFKTVFVGFVIMRLSLVMMWLRVARRDEHGRPAAIRYAIGLTICQLGWAIVVFVLPKSLIIGGFFAMLLSEHLVPIFSERASDTKWHRGHIIERYGLLTIIVLGEAILSLHAGLQVYLEQPDISIFTVLFGGLLILFSMWWLYFDEEEHVIMKSLRGAFAWGYGHFVVLISVAAVGAGLSVVVDQLHHHSEIALQVANAAVAIPLATFLLALWILHELPAKRRGRKLWLFPLGTVGILASLVSAYTVIISGILICIIVVLNKKRNATTQ